jgi:hypothetical protein
MVNRRLKKNDQNKTEFLAMLTTITSLTQHRKIAKNRPQPQTPHPRLKLLAIQEMEPNNNPLIPIPKQYKTTK